MFQVSPGKGIKRIEFWGTWRTSNKSAASNPPPGTCTTELITHCNRKMCWSTVMHEPHILVCISRYSLKQLRKKSKICIRATLLRSSKSPHLLGHPLVRFIVLLKAIIIGIFTDKTGLTTPCSMVLCRVPASYYHSSEFVSQIRQHPVY
ncbi:hypothetical protein TNCV_1057331 [Trichonephila clavipes]|nr:hypothetical protein TNCV_1057331 [Trichonephila clavipes]